MNEQETVLIADRYLVEEAGTFRGSVELWNAFDQQLERPITIQMLGRKLSANEQACDTFLKHQRAASSIQDSTIFAVYDAGVWQERAYSVMQRLDGAPASTLYRPGYPPDAEIALRITRQVAQALLRCRQEGLADWVFAPEAVYIDHDGDARLAVIEGLRLPKGEGDLQALGRLLKLGLAGDATADSAKLHDSQVPGSVIALIERLDGDRSDAITSVGDLLGAITALEAEAAQPTEAYEAVAQPDAQGATLELSEAPTLAAAILPAPYGQQPVARVAQAATSGSGQAYMGAAPGASQAAMERSTRALTVYPARAGAKADPVIVSRRMPWLVPVLLVLIMFLLGFMGVKLFGHTTKVEGEAIVTPTSTPVVAQKVLTDVTVPDLKGKSVDAAMTLLRSDGLVLAQGGSAYNATYANGQITSQQPASGTQLKAGSTITVTLSLGQAPTNTVSKPAAPPPTPQPPAPHKGGDKGKPPDKGKGHK